MKLILIYLATMFFFRQDAQAQKAITLKDVAEIRRQAKSDVKHLQDLLNKISYKDNTPADVLESIRQSSLDTSRNRIFLNGDIFVQDDIDPSNTIDNSTELKASQYLQDFNVKYEKTAEYSIDFSDISFSDIKSGDYIYLVARFKSTFGGYYKKEGHTRQKYPVRNREVEIRAEPLGKNNWMTSILSIRFFDPTIPPDSDDDVVPVKPDSVSETYMTPTEVKAALTDILEKDETEERKKIDLAIQCFEQAKKDVNNDDLDEAVQLILKAEALSPYDQDIYQVKLLINKLAVANTYERLKSQGDLAKSRHDYDEAVRLYRKALKRRPVSDLAVTEIEPILRKQSAISECQNKLTFGDPLGAIRTCQMTLAKGSEPNSKGEFPELYFISAHSWEQLLATKPNDKNLRRQLVSCLDSAINFFPGYIDAHSYRAQFFLSHATSRADSVAAISDYDAITYYLPDDAAPKITFLLIKARLNSRLKNYSGTLKSYDQAIRLNPAVDSLYTEKASFLYECSHDTAARLALDTSIQLNKSNAFAHYLRGLAWIRLQNCNAAGQDFSEAERLGITTAQSNVVDNICNAYLSEGKNFLRANDFKNAEFQFRNAFGVRPRSAEACFYLGEVSFGSGKELQTKPSELKDSFLRAISFYNMALIRKPDYPDALVQMGTALYQIGIRDSALICLNRAISVDEKNKDAYARRADLNSLKGLFDAAISDYNMSLQLLAQDEIAAKASGDKFRENTISEQKADVNTLLGISQYLGKHYANARLSLKLGVGPNKNHAEAYYYLGLVSLSLGDLSKSTDYFETAVGISADPRYYFDYGRAFFAQRNFKKAIDNFIAATHSDSSDRFKSGYHWLGLCYFKIDTTNVGQSLHAYDEYLKTKEGQADADFLKDLGIAQLYTGQDSLAQRSLNQALVLSPSDVGIVFFEGCFYARERDYDHALKFFQQAFALGALTDDDISQEEALFLKGFLKNRLYRSLYKAAKEANKGNQKKVSS